MTAKEYLLQASTIRRQVKRTEEKIEEIETMMQNVRAIRYDKLNVQSSPSGDRLAEAAEGQADSGGDSEPVERDAAGHQL